MQAAVTIDLGHLPYNKCRLLWTKVLSTVWEGSPHTMCCPKMHYECCGSDGGDCDEGRPSTSSGSVL